MKFLTAEGEAFSLDGITLEGAIEVGGETVALAFAQMGENEVLVEIPALDEGRYAYSITARSQDGSETVLCRGVVASVAVPALPGEEDGASSYPTLRVRIPDEAEPVRLRWERGTAALMAAERAEAAERRTLENVELLEGAREAVQKLNGSVADAIKVSPAGTLVIGGVDTQHPVQGPPGQSGAEVNYHVIASAAQLPTDAEHCSALHRYIVNLVAAKAEAEVQFLYDAWPCTVVVNGRTFEANGIDSLVTAINADTATCVDASVSGRTAVLSTLKLTAKEAGEYGNLIQWQVNPGDEFANEGYLQGGTDSGVVQYVWADGQWVVLSLTASTIATQTNHGYVRLGVPGGSGNMVPVVEGADGGVYVNIPSLTQPDLYPVEGSTAVVQSGGIRQIIENRSNPVTQELLTSGGGVDSCHSMGWIDLGPMWTRRMPDNVESIGLRCRADGTGAQANAYMEISPASDFSWGVKRSTNAQTQSPGTMCVWTFPAATNFCNGVDRVYIRLVNAAGTALPLACALYVPKEEGDTTVVRRVNGGVVEQINACPQMSFTGKSDLALALAGLEARVAALETGGGDAVTHDELEEALAGKQDVPAAGKHFVVSATATGLEVESGSHTASPVEGTIYITLPSES